MCVKMRREEKRREEKGKRQEKKKKRERGADWRCTFSTGWLYQPVLMPP
jgi:hypothetical protein